MAATAEHLEAVSRRQIRRLQINQPPGTMKSMTASVMFGAWEWGPRDMAWLRYLTTSYREDYARRDSRRMRDLVLSEWYRALWPVRLVRDSETDYENQRAGGRRAAPFASLTAGRGNRVIIDDPHSVVNVESDPEREGAVRMFRESVTSRLNDPISDAIIVIMHRLHPKDICGEIERLGLDYVKLILPMEHERGVTYSTPYYRDPRTEDGELLCPERVPRDINEQAKLELGSHAYATQFQQRGVAREGGMFKRHWFRVVDAAPAGARKVRRWDLAATEQAGTTDPDWTASVLMSEHRGHYYVEEAERMRVSAKRVRDAMRNTASRDGHEVTIHIPQDPGQAGKAQAQDVIADLAGYVVRAERETGAKETRAEPLAVQLEAGNVSLVRGAWNAAFIDELCDFPAGHDDQVDAASGAFIKLARNGGKFNISDALLARVALGR